MTYDSVGANAPDEPPPGGGDSSGEAAGTPQAAPATPPAPPVAPASPGPPPAAPGSPQVAPTAEDRSESPSSPGLDPSMASGIRPTTAIAAIKPEDMEAWKAKQKQEEQGKPAGKQGGPFLDPDEVQKAADRRGLKIDPGVYAAAIAALASGRHLVLTGGTGTGKTSFAMAIAEAAVRMGRCKSVLFTSAGERWGGGEVLGRRDRDSNKFEPGYVPTAINNDQWLIIDELDRANLDRALGRVSTILAGQAVDLPHGGGELKPGANWRILATMADIAQVGQTSPALRRRFVFVEVPILEREDLDSLVEQWASDDEVAAKVGKRLVAINDVVPLGPGLYKDAVAYVSARRKLAPVDETNLTLEALAGFVLPQLEGAGEDVALEAFRAAGLGG